MPSAAAAEASVREPSTRPYDGDVFAWATTQARLIRDGRFESVDREGVAEEIESVGRSETSELRRRTQTLLEHLYKVDASAASEPRANWRETVRRSRREIKRLLDDSPSLRRDLAALLVSEQESTARFTVELLEDAGESAAAILDRLGNGGFTFDQVFGSWFPGDVSEDR